MGSARSTSAFAGSLGILHSIGSLAAAADGRLLDLFLDRGDPSASEAAFCTLVERHGPMVYSVCRRRLCDADDAQDAFQATFLILARKASSIRHRPAIGGWLFVTAARAADRARTAAERRRSLELSVVMSGRDRPMARTPADEDAETRAILHEEVERLPQVFRDAVVLHYFEGLGVDAIASRLRCPRGSVLSRLARARDRLRRRLERRGAAPGMGVSVAWLAARLRAPAAPREFIEVGARCGRAFALGASPDAGAVPATVEALSGILGRAIGPWSARRGVLGALPILIAVGFAAMAAAPFPAATGEGPEEVGVAGQAKSASAPASSPRGDESRGETVTVRGRVLNGAGHPVRGARIVFDPRFVSVTGEEFGIPRDLSTTSEDGRFSFSLSAAEARAWRKIGKDNGGPPGIVVLVNGNATGWADLNFTDTAAPDVELKLPAEDVPIVGRLLDERGNPVPGVRASVFYIAELWGGDPLAFLERARSKDRKIRSRAWEEPRLVAALAFYPGGPSAVTGPAGEFRLPGIGSNRLVMLQLHGPTVESTQALVLTSPGLTGLPLEIADNGMGVAVCHGPRFKLVMRPGRELVGGIRDLETGQPIPGIRLLAVMGESDSYSTASADGQGHFRLQGMPVGKELKLALDPLGQPYFAANRTIGIPPGFGPYSSDLTLKRGVKIEGRVTRRDTGQPVRARVTYFPLKDNAVFSRLPLNRIEEEYATTRWADYDGRYRIVVLPGPGMLYVNADDRGLLTAQEIPQEFQEGVGNKAVDRTSLKAYRRIDLPGSVRTLAAFARTRTLNALTQDFALEPGREIKVAVVKPDGSPATSVRPLRADVAPCSGTAAGPGTFRYLHGNVGEIEKLPFLDPSRSLGGAIELDGRDGGPVRLTLTPTGVVRGRLVDDRGRPRGRVSLDVLIVAKARSAVPESERIVTGTDGRFEVTGVIPGCTYRIDVAGSDVPPMTHPKEGYLRATRWTLKPGEVLDWGDVRAVAFDH
jgi:RNA polymerase sigma factor (sigma-70 family)